MADVQVTCITKSRPGSSHEHITHLGSAAGGWKWTSDKVIDNIDAYANTFYVIDPKSGKRSDVGVYRVSGKAPYLRARAGGDWNNDLLSLGQCP